MKRLIFRVAMLVLTFLLGIGLDRVLSSGPVQMQVPQPVAVMPEPVAAPVAVAPPIATPTRHIIFDFNPGRFHPEGIYVLVGQKPKEFAEFQSIAMGLDSIGDGQLLGSVAVGTMTKGEYDYQNAIFALVSERRVFLVTPAFQEGFEYRFDGEFLRPDLWSANQNMTVLRGTLTKTRKGRKVAERVVSFRFEEDQC